MECSNYIFRKIGGYDDYLKCKRCGLVINNTFYQLSYEEREKTNDSFCESYLGTNNNISDPNWIIRIQKQADVISKLIFYNVFNMNDRFIDYGCGDGKLAKIIDANYKVWRGEKTKSCIILKYDKWSSGKKGYLIEKVFKKQFDVVISCSVLEHLVGTKQIRDLMNLIGTTGTFCLHTLICENVPCDPDWFYLDYRGCYTMWTNAAMSIMYEEYKFLKCAYNVESKMFFSRDEGRTNVLQENIGGTWIIDDKFIDYWHEAPYR